MANFRGNLCSAKPCRCCFRRIRGHVSQIRSGGTRAEGAEAKPTPEQQKIEMEKAMQDPAVQERMKQMQEAMKRPEVQQQMQEMQQAMANPELQKRVAALRDDPEFKDMFEEIQKGGMGALMKYMNDPALTARLGAKLGDVPDAPPAPEVSDLIDAARHRDSGRERRRKTPETLCRLGDEEATEDFIAVGKDVNMQDAEGRTPLHFAAAHSHTKILQALLDAGADHAKADSKSNTALHYATGYGRVDAVSILLDAGADIKSKNVTDKTPLDVAKLNPENPLFEFDEIVKRLTP